jgi:hypothetical protein
MILYIWNKERDYNLLTKQQMIEMDINEGLVCMTCEKNLVLAGEEIINYGTKRNCIECDIQEIEGGKLNPL